MPQGTNNALILLMPTRGSLAVETHEALSNHMDDIPNIRVIAQREPVDKARNMLAATATRIATEDPLHIGPAGYLALWIDDDVWWPAGTISAMLRAMQCDTTIDLLCAHFCVRYPSMSPALAPKGLKALIETQNANKEGFYLVRADAIGWKPGELNEIEGCGFHFVMHRLSALERLGAEPFAVLDELAEDESFCKRANAAGLRMLCHTGLNVAHIDVKSGLAFVPFAPALQVYGDNLIYASQERLADFVPDERCRSDRKYGAAVDRHRKQFDETTKNAKTYILDCNGVDASPGQGRAVS